MYVQIFYKMVGRDWEPKSQSHSRQQTPKRTIKSTGGGGKSKPPPKKKEAKQACICDKMIELFLVDLGI